MNASTQTAWLTLPAAARRLAIPWSAAWRKLLTRELEDEQDKGGRWRITEESVRRLEQERAGETARAS